MQAVDLDRRRAREGGSTTSRHGCGAARDCDDATIQERGEIPEGDRQRVRRGRLRCRTKKEGDRILLQRITPPMPPSWWGHNDCDAHRRGSSPTVGRRRSITRIPPPPYNSSGRDYLKRGWAGGRRGWRGVLDAQGRSTFQMGTISHLEILLALHLINQLSRTGPRRTVGSGCRHPTSRSLLLFVAVARQDVCIDISTRRIHPRNERMHSEIGKESAIMGVQEEDLSF